MMLNDKQDKHEKSFELAPEGTHNAICYRVVDLGTHKVEGQFALDDKGNQKWHRKISLYFEIEETMSDGRRFMVFETFTASFGEKANLRRFIKNWLGGDPALPFDTDTLVGKGGLLSIAHKVSEKNGRTYVNVMGILPLPKGMKPLRPENEAFAFDIATPFDKTKFEKLSEWTRATINQSREMRAPEPEVIPDDDIPF